MKRLVKIGAKPGCTKRQRALLKKHAGILEKHLGAALLSEDGQKELKRAQERWILYGNEPL
jgi:hypothetical protein